MNLKEHTVKSYDKDLLSIQGTIDEMSHLILESIDIVQKSISSNDKNLVEIIKTHDYKINSLDFLIEKKVTAMLALRQPMAVDLRYIVSALKVSSNLERIGDQSKNIIAKLVEAKDISKNVEEALNKMVEISKIMVVQSVKSFNNQDFEIAKFVQEKDDEIDKIYQDLFKIIDHENFTITEVQDIVKILFIAKSFERLADHTTNIAEIAQYVITGETK